MDKGKGRLIELGKDVLILLLTCSALWLAVRNQLIPMGDLLPGEEALLAGDGQTQAVGRAEAARPLRMAARLPDGSFYSALNDDTASGALFQQVAGVLVETLSTAGEPEKIGRRQWEDALESAPGVMLDFQGSIPLSVLSGWLSGEEIPLDTPVRRLALTVWQGSAALCYRDESTGQCFRCRSQVANPLHLEEALSSLSGNGAFYAFQSEAYTMLDGDTLLSPTVPAPAVCTASNPMAGGRTALEELMEDLGIPINANGTYRGADEWVARSGGATLRLSDRGRVVYEAAEEPEDRFALAGGAEASLFDQVEACRRLAFDALSSRSGQGRLYLMSAAATQEGLEVEFGCSLNGLPVLLEEGPAARFLVREGRIEQFELYFRSYTAGEETCVVLPVRQAAAALEAGGLEGEELLLVYNDTGGDRLEASWAASRRLTGEG